MSAFARSKWDTLSPQEKKKHTLSECERCRQKYCELQRCFPGKAIFDNDLCSKVTEIIGHSNLKTRKKAIDLVVSPIENAFKAKFGEGFATAFSLDSIIHLGRKSISCYLQATASDSHSTLNISL